MSYVSAVIAFMLSEQGQNLVVWLLPMIGGWIAGTSWWKERQTETRRKIKECFEAGVQAVYDDFVRQWKLESGDGKLTEDQRKEAFDRAVAHAGELAVQQGIRAFKKLRPEVIALSVETAVQHLKKPKVKVDDIPVATRELYPDAN